MTTPLTILQRARLLIANPDNWIKGKLSDPDETCFCAMGALCHVRNRLKASTQAFNTAEQILDSVSRDRFGTNYVAYNDLESASHADILSLFDAALDAAFASTAPADKPQPNPGTPTPTPEPAKEEWQELSDALWGYIKARELSTPTSEVIASTSMNNPNPSTADQLLALHFAIRSVKAAQNSLLNANEALREAETKDFSASFPNPPVPLQEAIAALQKRIEDLMPKSQPGDRVRLIESKQPSNIGALLTIIGPVEGPAAGWYNAIADKPLLAVACGGDQFGNLFNEGDPQETYQAQVFCTRIEKVERIEDLIGELAPDPTALLQVCRSSKGWMVNLPAHNPYLEARDADLLTALTNLRDFAKEVNK